MPQFTLICEDETTTTTKEFDAMLLNEVVENTQDFLKGVGYVFEELHVQVYALEDDDCDDDGRPGGDLDSMDSVLYDFDR